MNALLEKYTKDIEAVLEKYPEDRKRSAVMPLLYIAQRDGGFVTKQDMADIGEIIGITSTEVASIVGFYTLYHDEQSGKYRIQVCTDMPCALRGAEEFGSSGNLALRLVAVHHRKRVVHCQQARILSERLHLRS